jgi:PAS domain S-box-containing protein
MINKIIGFKDYIPNSPIEKAINQNSIIAITDKFGTIIYVNDLFCKISKYSQDELLGNTHKIINSGFHSKQFFKNMWDTILQGETWRGEIMNRAKDGSYYWVDTTIAPILNAHNEPFQFVSIRTLITDRKEKEEALKSTEKRLIETKRLAKIGSCEINIKSKVVTASVCGLELLGISKEIPLTISVEKFISQYVYEEDKQKVEIFFSHLFQNLILKFRGFNYRIKTISGDIRDLEVVALRFHSGKELVTLVIQDITERKSAELQINNLLKETMALNEELLSSEEELRQNLERSVEINEYLQTTNEELDSVVYRSSHDLKAPLTALLGLIDLAKMDNVAGDVQPYLTLMEQSVNKYLKVIKDLTLFSRNNRLEIELSAVNIFSIIEETINELKFLPKANNISFKIFFIRMKHE